MSDKIENKIQCGIPSATIGLCDLEWGHIGDDHANAGDSFRSVDHWEEHARRQNARAKDDPIYRVQRHCHVRIEECRRVEDKFTRDMALRGRQGRVSTAPMAQTMIEAWTERMTLQRIQRILADIDELE